MFRQGLLPVHWLAILLDRNEAGISNRGNLFCTTLYLSIVRSLPFSVNYSHATRHARCSCSSESPTGVLRGRRKLEQVISRKRTRKVAALPSVLRWDQSRNSSYHFVRECVSLLSWPTVLERVVPISRALHASHSSGDYPHMKPAKNDPVFPCLHYALMGNNCIKIKQSSLCLPSF